jgi:hypothetical protein
MRTLTLSCALALSVLLASSCANADEWYEKESNDCSGIRSLADAIAAYTGAPLGISVQRGAGTGNYYVTLPANTLNMLSTKQEQQINVVQLDKSKADGLRRAFANEAGATKVPMFEKTGISRVAMTLPSLLGKATNLAFNFLFAQADATATAINEVRGYIAEGGRVYDWLTVLRRKDDDNIFLSISTEYQVNLGNEIRTFVVQDCIYPAAVTVSEFESVAPLGPKGYTQIIRRLPDQRWALWDNEEQRYMTLGGYFKYLYQAGGFYYFEQGGDLQRVSLFGGPWQFMYASDRPSGAWHNTYTKMIAR